jgi:molybdopterin-synthase adenylyltransferase
MAEIKYDRQSLIPGWDQAILSDAKVAVIGAGALGNHVCLGLIGLGIGTIKIFDFDTIEAHNLNRQSLFCEEDIGENKAEALAHRLEERNASIFIAGIDEKIEEDTIEDIIRDVDAIIDCVDLIYVRRILSRYCLTNDIPLIHGGISWIGGQTGILTRETPCINCIFPEELQKQELDVETSCTRKPEASVVYCSQIIAGLMVSNLRKVLLPLEMDTMITNQEKSSKKPNTNFLTKVDLRLPQPIYLEPTYRKSGCECIKILKKVDPKILKIEQKAKKLRTTQEKKDLAEALKKGLII